MNSKVIHAPIENLYSTYKTYLVGAMECTADKDFGKGWRDVLKPKLEEYGIYVFDPTREEKEKVGVDTKEFHKKLMGWKASGNWDIYTREMDKIWRGRTYLDEEGKLRHLPGDKDYVDQSDFITAHVNSNDRPCGTYVEIGMAWLFNIPIYLITDSPKTELNGSLLYFVLNSGGEVFRSTNEYLEYIIKEYNLKRMKKNGKA